MARPTLMFYDVLARHKFRSNIYRLQMDKNKRPRAVVKAPSGVKSYRYVTMKFYKRYKDMKR